jgi:ABC-type transport system involved in multi-copper enzyme maturation permease subunit
MREVVWKDLLLNRSVLLPSLLLFAVMFGVMAAMPESPLREYTVMTSVVIAFLPVMIVTGEDKARAMALTCSLPVTRRTVVRARFVLAGLMGTCGVLFSLGLAAVLPTSTLPAAALFHPANLLMGFTVVLFIMSLMLPLTLRFGARGVILLLVVMQVIGVVLLTVVQVTRSSADKRLVGAIVRGVGDLAARLGPWGFYALVALALGVVVTVSYRVSVRAFVRREL